MADQRLKHMKRAKLLELLIAQMEENEVLRTQLAEANRQLQSREITIQHAGSIAEAVLPLNGVFRAAEQAAQQYLENIQALSGRQQEVCAQMEAEAQKKAQAILAEADAYWAEVQQKVQAFCREQESLRGLLQYGDKKPGIASGFVQKTPTQAVPAEGECTVGVFVGQPQKG